MIRPRLRVVLLTVTIWTALALAFAVQFYAVQAIKQDNVSWGRALLWSLNDWLPWILLTPIVLVVANRWPLERGRLWPALGFHAAAMLGVSAVHATLYHTAERMTAQLHDPTLTWLAGQRLYLAKKIVLNAVVYWGLVGLSHAHRYYRLYRERERQAAQLGTRLARAQLDALRAQLHPHFLFNTLNSISALMHRDVEAADRMVTRLGDLLRLSLRHTERQEVPLRQELEFLAHYLAIQRMRFPERLRVQEIVAPEALDALVPSLVLQPLVENAVRHAVEPSTAPVTVTLSARVEENMVTLEVLDDGPGMPAERLAAIRRTIAGSGEASCGIGLGNTAARLHQLYGSDQRFDITASPGGGVRIALRLPLRLGTLPTPLSIHV